MHSQGRASPDSGRVKGEGSCKERQGGGSPWAPRLIREDYGEGFEEGSGPSQQEARGGGCIKFYLGGMLVWKSCCLRGRSN